MPRLDLAAAHRPWLPAFPFKVGETACRHELSEGVAERIIAAVGGFRRLYRFQNWIRRGYVEELFVAD